MFVECRHILPRGTKCKSPALRGRPYCFFHDSLHHYAQDGLRDDAGPFTLPFIEDACGIQQALMQVMTSMVNGRLDSRDGVRLIYGLQVAMQALDRIPSTPPNEIVDATECDGSGVDVGLDDQILCEPHAECPTCANRFGCRNIARQNQKSIRDLKDESRDRLERAEREPLALPASATPGAALCVPDLGNPPGKVVHISDAQKIAEYERHKRFLSAATPIRGTARRRRAAKGALSPSGTKKESLVMRGCCG